MVCSVRLRDQIIKGCKLEQGEIHTILQNTWHTLIAMKPLDLAYATLNSLTDLKKKYFFQPQQILEGKTFCDICLNDPKSIEEGIKQFKSGNWAND